MVSIPASSFFALQKDLNPSIGSVARFTARWYCSTMLLSYLHCRSSISRQASSLTLWIADGDTITVLDANKVQHKIRLSGIDAPEKKQPFGNRSKESLSALAFDKTVNVETSKRDRYGRQIGKVLGNRRDVRMGWPDRKRAFFNKSEKMAWVAVTAPVHRPKLASN